jgi:hypothetical protein
MTHAEAVVTAEAIAKLPERGHGEAEGDGPQ